MNKRERRLSQIEDYVNRNKIVSIRTLSDLFDVAYMTIHRDLKHLAEEYRLSLMRGVALAKNQEEDHLEYRFSEERESHPSEKKLIGERAAQMVEEDDVIIFDAGTTTEAIAAAVPPHYELTVITHALNIINYIHHNTTWNLIVPGGQYHRNSPLFESEKGCEYLRSMRATKAFVSASGVSLKLGVTCKNVFEIQMKNAILESSDTRILVVDSSKFDTVQVAHFAELSDFDMLISNRKFSTAEQQMLKNIPLTPISV